MKILSYYTGVNTKASILVYSTIISFIVSDIIIRLLNYRKKPFQIHYDKVKYAKILSRLIKIWFISNLVTVIVQKGFPLLWLIRGDSKTYADFGFPSIQGVLNSIYYISVIGNMFLLLKEKEKNRIKNVILLLMYPILIMSRGLLVVILMEILGLYLLLFKIHLKNFAKLVFVILLAILLFGYLGDIRVTTKGTSFLYSAISEDYVKYFEHIPSGFIWIYWYFTASFENIVSNIENISPTYTPYYSTKALFPTVIRNLIFKKLSYEERYSLKMKNSIINTFTIFANYLKDFGMGITIILFGIFQFFSCYIYHGAKNNKFNLILIYPVIFMVIVLSVFTDYFLILPVLLQIALSNYIGLKVTTKGKVLLDKPIAIKEMYVC